MPIDQILGRILAEDLLADRDSPAVDVSGMDGYAVRIGDVRTVSLPIQATIAAGSPPISLLPGHAMRIFTGAPVPAEADCVVRREDTLAENDQQVKFGVPASNLLVGLNIRRHGENIREQHGGVPAGTKIEDSSTSRAMSASVRVSCRCGAYAKKVRSHSQYGRSDSCAPGADRSSRLADSRFHWSFHTGSLVSHYTLGGSCLMQDVSMIACPAFISQALI